MDLLKAPSVQSLLDSDLESVESFQYMDIEELDEVEYALPASEAPTLAEVLSAEDDEAREGKVPKAVVEPNTCSALQVDFLQAVSQQLTQAQERSSAGSATTLSVGKDGKLTVGTAHGHLLTFYEQTLRWVCDSNTDRGAVSCLAYNEDSTRLLAGYARGLICQYESIRGVVLRRVTLGCEIWGTLKVTWAGTSGLALDTGGSVWLIKFSRPLGVRSARTSCLFSGARGEVVAMTARDARILALATLSRVIIVAGGKAAGVRLAGPPDTLPVLEWSETDDRVLVCARAKILQWLTVNITGTTISLRPMQRIELKTTPLWLGWLSGALAIFDVDENLRLCGDDYDKPLDLSHVEPVYASAFFKGHWTDGRVSRAMCAAGASALGGACVGDGALSLLGRKGIVRVRLRDLLARAHAFISSGRYSQALRLLCSTKGPEARSLANLFVDNISQRPHVLRDKQVGDLVVKLCLKYNLNDELWGSLWENCSSEHAFVEALGDAAVRGELAESPPTPDITQELIERLAEFEPGLVERVVVSLPLTALDPHRASVFTREKRLWRGVGAIAAALGGASGAIRELVYHVSPSCRGGVSCSCAGGALLLCAADALGGRGAGGRPLPPHAQPKARHDALLTLLEEDSTTGKSPLQAVVEHDAVAAARLLEQSARDPPFAGPLGKQNRLRVARALLLCTQHLQDSTDRLEILEFVSNQVSSGALPFDQEVIKSAQKLAASTSGERADRAWLALLTRGKPAIEQLTTAREQAAARPRILWRIDALLNRHDDALQQFFQIESPSNTDIDEIFEYIRTRIESDGKNILEPYLVKLVALRPRAAAAVISEHFPDNVEKVLRASKSIQSLEFAEYLIEAGRLKGDAAAVHLRNLCALRPHSVTAFLLEHAGVVRPEDALGIVKESELADAEPTCLEAIGDFEGALDAILRLIVAADERDDKEKSARLVSGACGVCSRAACGAPPPAAAAMWARLVRAAAPPPPALLLAAAAHLPATLLIERTCDSPEAALTILECASSQVVVWSCLWAVAGRELHGATARARRAAARARPVRGGCGACGGALAVRPPVLALCCAGALHRACKAPSTCAVCARRLPEQVFAFLPRQQRTRSPPPPQEHSLMLVAPPRPDLEGIV